jgi:hypothetical protein
MLSAMSVGRNALRLAVRAAALAPLLAGCAPGEAPPEIEFWNRVRALCGQAFEGRALELTAVDSAIAGQRLVLDVWQCYHDEMRLAFHVGDDHSRVWKLTREQDVPRLTHEFHADDGAPAAVTGYGGPALGHGTATAQTFAADAATLTRIPSAAGATWTLEIGPRQTLAYAFRSGDGAVTFRVEFDVSRHTQQRPPPPWGYTRQRRPGSRSDAGASGSSSFLAGPAGRPAATAASAAGRIIPS